jgi:uncharacterized membrane protein YfhO
MLKWTTSKISDEYMPGNFVKPQTEAEISRGILNGVKGETLLDKTDVKEFYFTSAEPGDISVNIAYFPAWKVYIDGKSTGVNNNHGRVAFHLPGGSHKVLFRFEQTGIEKLAGILSLIGIGATLAVIMLGVKQRNEKKA